jgi:aquaporin Z
MMAEFVGVFLFVFVGAGSVIAAQAAFSGSAALVAIAFANGLGLALAISLALNTSGGHINPAVTIGAWVTKKIGTLDAAGYIVAQVLGAILAGVFLVALYPSAAGMAVHYGAPSLASGTSVLQGIVLEGIMTFFLVTIVFATVIDNRFPKMGGLFVGLVVVADVFAGGPLTGAAMNPARAIGPALASGFLTNWYVYWIGPVIGGVLAAWVYNYMFLRKKNPRDDKRK